MTMLAADMFDNRRRLDSVEPDVPHIAERRCRAVIAGENSSILFGTAARSTRSAPTNASSRTRTSLISHGCRANVAAPAKVAHASIAARRSQRNGRANAIAQIAVALPFASGEGVRARGEFPHQWRLRYRPPWARATAMREAIVGGAPRTARFTSWHSTRSGRIWMPC